jgi:predicted dehydrogenase
VKNRTTRRHFLQQSALVGAGAWLTAGDVLAEPRSANEKLNLGFIGVGGKGETALLAFGGQNVVALCDVDENRAARAFSLRSRYKMYHDYRKMLEKQQDLDAVIVSTPDHHHAPASIMAMKLGRHVYCEKPIAHNIREARLMRQVAADTKVVTQMGNQGHAGAAMRRAVELVQAGAIGKVREFHAWTDRPSWPQQLERPEMAMPVPSTLQWDLWLGPAAQRPYNDVYLPFKWRGWWDFGSGALGDMACHVADLGFWALKLESPVSVEATVSKRLPDTAPNWSIIKYEFPARGEMPPVTFTWYDGGKKPDAALADGQPLPGNGSILVGDAGTLYVPDTYGAKFKLLPEDKFVEFEGPDPTLPRVSNHWAEWLAACKGGPATQSHFDYAGPLTETVLLGTVAIRCGQKIDWDGPNMQVTNCPEAAQYVRREYRPGWEL